VHEVARPEVTIARDHGASRGDVLECVLPDMVAPLKQDRAPIEVYSVVRSSVSFYPGMPHRIFRVPSRALKS